MKLDKRRLYPFLFALISVLFLNILHTAFFFQRGYKPFTLNYSVTAPYNTIVWHAVKPKYKKDTYLTKKTNVVANQPTEIQIQIDEPQGVQILGIYWSRADRGSFAISKANVISEQKTFNYTSPSQMVGYSSHNIETQISEGTISASSIEKGNGWYILNTLEIENLAKKKLFTPFGWITNLLLFALFLVLGFLLKHPRQYLDRCLISGSNYDKIRGYALFLWVFLLPFWNQVSHVFLGIATAAFLWGWFMKKLSIQKRDWRLFIGLWVFFVSLLLIDVFFHIEMVSKDFENYIYFLLAPFIFWGIPKTILQQVMRIFQFGILVFAGMLFFSVMQRHFEFSATESFKTVFFAITEGYWHSSYLAGFIVVAHLFALKNDPNIKWALLLTPATLCFFYITEARLPGLAFLVIGILVLIGRMDSKKWRRTILGVASIVLCSMLGYFVSNGEARSQFIASYLYTKTEKMDVRPMLWDAGFSLIQEHQFTGIGRKNIRTALTETIPQETKIKFRNYNMHNQYLEWWLGYGLMALVLFIGMLVYPLRQRVPNYLWFLGYFSIVLCVESYFARQAGVVFFSLWYCYFIMYDRTNSNSTKPRD